MGNFMGHVPQNGFDLFFKPEVTPHPLEEPTFDPMLGFPSARKPREKQFTDEEMESAKIPLNHRDYCAHKLLEYLSCYKGNFPWVVNCHHEKHEYLTCKHEDYVLRAKEYERERRLRVKREKCKKELAAQEVSVEA